SKNKDEENNQQKLLIHELKEKIKVLEANHEECDLIKYYEDKIEEEYNSKINLIKSFTKSIEKIFPDNTYVNKELVWRNVLKKYEQEIINLEDKISEMKKNERKIYQRQKFFDKYCSQTEERIETISKISKKFYNQEKVISEL